MTKYQKLNISDDDYDAIYSSGYEACLLDCKEELVELLNSIRENHLDAEETLEGFVEGMIEALGNDYTQ